MDKQENIKEIDLLIIFNKIIKNKFLIIFVTLIFAISSVFYSLSLKNYYISSAVLSITNVSSEQNGFNSLSSSYGGLAALAGISLPSSEGNSAAYAVNIIESREFLKHLLTFEKVLPSIMAPEEYNIQSQELSFDSDLYNEKDNEWVRIVAPPKKTIPSYLETYKTYKESLDIKIDNKTGYIHLSYEHISPVFAYNFMNLIISQVNSLSKKKDFIETSEALEYLYSEYTKESYDEIKKSINKLIESQLETKMFANIRDDYLLSILDPPFIPEKKSKPSRAKICIFVTFFGFIFSILFVLLRELYKKR